MASLAFSYGIMESVGVLAGFDVSKKIWERYQAYAIPKIAGIAEQIRGEAARCLTLNANEAAHELANLREIVPIITSLHHKIDLMEGKEFHAFKHASLDYFDAMAHILAALQEASEENAPYIVSHEVLSKDWDKKEDDHWDNY